jgi:hypothetical protein
MRRRLTILFVDAMVFSMIAAAALWLFGFESPVSEAAEPLAMPELTASAAALAAEIPDGLVPVGARVVPERSADLIMPGDKVDLARGAGQTPVLRGVQIVSIAPPLMQGDDRVHVTFALEPYEASRLKDLRDTNLLSMRLAGIGPTAASRNFPSAGPEEVITLRFEEASWERRITAE